MNQTETITNNETENINNETEQAPKRKRGKPAGIYITAHWRHLENGKYDSRPTFKHEYLRNYYRNEGQAAKVKSPFCNSEVVNKVLGRPQKSNKCNIAQESKQAIIN